MWGLIFDIFEHFFETYNANVENILSTFDIYRRLSEIPVYFWHFPVYFGLLVSFSVSFAKFFDIRKLGKFSNYFRTLTLSDVWLSRNTENFRQTHGLIANLYLEIYGDGRIVRLVKVQQNYVLFENPHNYLVKINCCFEGSNSLRVGEAAEARTVDR